MGCHAQLTTAVWITAVGFTSFEKLWTDRAYCVAIQVLRDEREIQKQTEWLKSPSAHIKPRRRMWRLCHVTTTLTITTLEPVVSHYNRFKMRNMFVLTGAEVLLNHSVHLQSWKANCWISLLIKALGPVRETETYQVWPAHQEINFGSSEETKLAEASKFLFVETHITFWNLLHKSSFRKFKQLRVQFSLHQSYTVNSGVRLHWQRTPSTSEHTYLIHFTFLNLISAYNSSQAITEHQCLLCRSTLITYRLCTV
jgi:hypothetical protein